MKKLIAIALFALLAVACTEKQEPITGKSRAGKAGEDYLAKVNTVPIRAEDIEYEFNMLPFQVQQMFMGEGGMEGFLEELIKKEMLYQEANKRNYISKAEFKKREADFRKRLMIEFLLEDEVEKKSIATDSEIREYYDKNIQDFVLEVPDKDEPQTLEFDAVKELIRQRLVAEKEQDVFDSYVTGLRKSYKVSLNENAVRQAFGNKTAP
jgi:hypothetical protein